MKKYSLSSIKSCIFYKSLKYKKEITVTFKNLPRLIKQRKSYRKNKKQTIFITGDLGVIGRVVANKLVNRYNIIGYDKAVNPFERLSNYYYLNKKMRGCDHVIHLAAIPHPYLGSMADYFHTNVVGTLNVLKSAKNNNIKKFIYLSSTGYYGCDINGKLYPKYLPIDEAHPVASKPNRSTGELNEYNRSKVLAEELCAYYGRRKLFEVIVFRSGPANENNSQYPDDFDWKTCKDWRRGAFFCNNPTINLANAIHLALKSKKKFYYEPFNITNKYTDKKINVEEFIRKEYPRVEIKISLKNNPSLIDIRKAEKILRFKAIDNKKIKKN